MEQAVSANDPPLAEGSTTVSLEANGTSLLAPLLQGRRQSMQSSRGLEPILGVIIGELLAITDDGSVPLVRYEGQAGSGAVRARTTIDLHGPHIGSSVVLMFENGDASLPIVLGVLHDSAGWPMDDRPAQVEVDADGHRMMVTAREQLILRCGKASITLTKAGKVSIEGSYVESRSTGVNRIKGGSVQIN